MIYCPYKMSRLFKFLLTIIIVTICFFLFNPYIGSIFLPQDIFTAFCAVVATSSGVLLGFGLAAITLVAQYPVTSLIEIKSNLSHEKEGLKAWSENNNWKDLLHYQELSENIHKLYMICDSALNETPVETKSVDWFNAISDIRKFMKVIVTENIKQFGLIKKVGEESAMRQLAEGEDSSPSLDDIDIVEGHLVKISGELFRIVHRSMLDRLQEVLFEWCKIAMGVMIVSIILIPISGMKFKDIEFFTSSCRIYSSVLIAVAFVMLAPIILKIISLYYESIKFDRKISITYDHMESI